MPSVRELNQRVAQLERQVATLMQALAKVPARIGANPGRGDHNTPNDLGTAATTDAAETDTMDRDSPASGKKGWDFIAFTRTAYNFGGDEKLYGYHRTFAIDSEGHIKTISAETRVEIEAPTVCI